MTDKQLFWILLGLLAVSLTLLFVANWFSGQPLIPRQ
jgi:hypothetical protein